MIELDITQNDVHICIPEQDNWRVALLNNPSGREQLAEVLADYPAELAEVLAVWGDEPTVPDPEPPEMPEGWEPPPDPMRILQNILGVDE